MEEKIKISFFSPRDISYSYYNLDLSVRPSVTYLLCRFRTDCNQTRQEGRGRDTAGAKGIGFHGNKTVVMAPCLVAARGPGWSVGDPTLLACDNIFWHVHRT